MFGGLFITFLLPFPYAPRLKLRLVGTITVLQPLAYMQALCFWLEFGLSNMCVYSYGGGDYHSFPLVSGVSVLYKSYSCVSHQQIL